MKYPTRQEVHNYASYISNTKGLYIDVDEFYNYYMQREGCVSDGSKMRDGKAVFNGGNNRNMSYFEDESLNNYDDENEYYDYEPLPGSHDYEEPLGSVLGFDDEEQFDNWNES